MGKGIDKISTNCKNGSCVMTVYRVDWYTDPEDISEIEHRGDLFPGRRTRTELLSPSN
jgi:hypothetical protein